jgi:ribosomal protein S18 acetylase RimI-like enzyme
MDARHVELGFAYASDAQPLALMSRDLIEAGVGWSYRRERILRFIADADAIVLVARHARQRIGFAIMSFGDQRAHLVLMAVHPSCQRRGIGRRMLQWLLDSAVVAGITTVDVELRAGNRAAYALYRHLGFDETSRVTGYYGGRETAVRMVRVLRLPGATAQSWRPPTHDRR